MTFIHHFTCITDIYTTYTMYLLQKLLAASSSSNPWFAFNCQLAATLRMINQIPYSQLAIAESCMQSLQQLTTVASQAQQLQYIIIAIVGSCNSYSYSQYRQLASTAMAIQQAAAIAIVAIGSIVVIQLRIRASQLAYQCKIRILYSIAAVVQSVHRLFKSELG